MAMDTLRFAEDLEKSGFDKPQAEGLARALQDHLTRNVATVADLQALESRLENHLLGTENRIDGRIHEVESRLTKWMVGLTLPVYGALFVILVRVFA